MNGRLCPTCVELLDRLSAASERLFEVSEHVLSEAEQPPSADTRFEDECARIRYLRAECGQIRERLERHCARQHSIPGIGMPA